MSKRMFRRRKDGSLNLSIQAIVVLVMAMALLGLGLGFIRGLMGKSQAQFETAIDNAQLENPASATNPVTVDKTVKIKSAGTAKISAGFYNSEASDVTVKPSVSGCGPLVLASGDQTVPGGQARGFSGVLSGTPTKDNVVCTIEFKTGSGTIKGSKQFFVDKIS